jgi:hypothetical protein
MRRLSFARGLYFDSYGATGGHGDVSIPATVNPETGQSGIPDAA